jgi:monomeric isocitrate dehydrogenase
VPQTYTVIVLAVLGAVVCAWQVRRAWLAHRTQQRHDVGPDALRLLQELDAHLDEYLLANPDVAAGFDRLRAAIRDEQQNGGTD